MKYNSNDDMKQICSLGGGEASTAMFLMSLHGHINAHVDAAVWADTGREPQSTHDTIAFLKEYAAEFDIPVYIVRATLADGDIWKAMLDPNSRNGQMPMFFYNKEGKKTMLRRYCTNEFKVYPIRRLIRSEFNASFKNPVNTWLGYTMDEITRMKPSKPKYEVRRYPLIENRIYRHQCTEYLKAHGLNFVQRSACTGCPYRLDNEYDILSDSEKQALTDFENKLNKTGYKMAKDATDTVEVRVHKSMIPIEQAPYKSKDEQLSLDDLCDGASCFT